MNLYKDFYWRYCYNRDCCKQRKGQAAFNALYQDRRTAWIAEELRGSLDDPFYWRDDDPRVTVFLKDIKDLLA